MVFAWVRAMTAEFQTEIDRRKRKGWRLHSVAPDASWALMVKGWPVHHWAQFFMFVITLGLWGIVWGLLIVFGGEKAVRVEMTRRGKVRVVRAAVPR